MAEARSGHLNDRLAEVWQAAAAAIPVSEAGSFRVVRSVVTEEDEAQYRKMAELCGETHFDRAGRYTTLLLDGEVLMSSTPDDMEDHREPYRQAKVRGGRCLVHGLGLGLITRSLLSLENVTHVDVVEIDACVLQLVAPVLEEFVQAGRLTIHHADCFKKRWPAGSHWTVVWHDLTWLPLLDHHLKEMARLHKMFASRCDWQGSWGRDRLLRRRAECERAPVAAYV